MKSNYSFHIVAKGEHAIRFRLKKDDHFLSFTEVFDLWEKENDFVDFYIESLTQTGYDAFYWEHPALQEEYSEERYECILQRSRPLERARVNEEAFKDYIHTSQLCVDFLNLGKNARLVVPTKQANTTGYRHLGEFIRTAQTSQIRAVFQKIGRVMKEELSTARMIWLNTAGLGVIWLHIRLDTRPKYYKTKQYKQEDFLKKV